MSGFELTALGWTPELAASLEPGLAAGRVAVQHRGRSVVYAEAGELRVRLPGRMRHRGELPAVGDWVGLDGDVVRRLLPRRTALVRQAAGRETQAQVLAANVDVAFLVSSLGPDLEPRRLERYLTLVGASGAEPVILLTKVDLCPDPAPFLAAVAAVAPAVPTLLLSARTGRGLEGLERHLRPGRTAVLLGSSGVGKSTIVNRLAGEELLRTQETRADDDEGRHTTSHRELVVLPGGALLIDTPGIRELQLWDAGEDGVAEAFADVDELARSCRFADCEHTHRVGCAVLEAVDAGTLPPARLDNYRELRGELDLQALRQDAGQAERARTEQRKARRRLARAQRKDSW